VCYVLKLLYKNILIPRNVTSGGASGASKNFL